MFFVFLLPFLAIIGFIVVFVIIILIICAIIFLIFTPLSVYMFVKSHKRKKQNKRMVPFFPLGFIFANFALGGLVPLIALGVAYTSFATKYPSTYVPTTMIDQDGYQSEYFTVENLSFKRIEGVEFLDFAAEMSTKEIFSYTYKNPLQKIESGNYYILPLETAYYTIVRGKERKGQYDYFALESQYNEVIEYFTSLTLDTNRYEWLIVDGNYQVDKEKAAEYKTYFLDNISSFYIENYSIDNEETVFKAKMLGHFRLNIFDENRYACKGEFSYCLYDNHQWYLVDNSTKSYYSYHGYELSEDIQNVLNYIYNL